MASPTFVLPARDFSGPASALFHAESLLHVVGLILDHYQNNPLPNVKFNDVIDVMAEMVGDSATLVRAVAERVEE